MSRCEIRAVLPWAVKAPFVRLLLKHLLFLIFIRCKVAPLILESSEPMNLESLYVYIQIACVMWGNGLYPALGIITAVLGSGGEVAMGTFAGRHSPA